MFEFNTHRRQQPNAVKMLIIANVVAFIMDNLFLQPSMGVRKTLLTFGFIPRLAFEGGYYWQVVTHMFMHGGFMHIFFNMFVFFMFGPHLERNMGMKRFLLFYFLCGFSAMGLQSLTQYDSYVPMVGASGAIMGVVAGFGYFFPQSTLLVFGVIPVKAWKLVVFYAVFELFQMIGNPNSMIANAAHFGGLVMGLLFLQLVYKKYPIFGGQRQPSPGPKQETRQRAKAGEKDPWGTVINLTRDDDGTWK